MSDEEPIDDDLARMLAKERQAMAPDAAVDRVRARLGPLLRAPTAALPTPKAPAHGWLAAHALPVAIASFVGGVATGVALHASLPKPPAAVVAREAPPTPAPAPTRTPADPAPPPREPPPVAPPPPMPHASAPAPAPIDSLRAERDVLDRARASLTSGDPAAALAALDQHAARFAKPQLGEEREALAIRALVALGRYDDARGRAKRFREATPGSLFEPAIESALGSIP